MCIDISVYLLMRGNSIRQMFYILEDVLEKINHSMCSVIPTLNTDEKQMLTR